MNYNDFKLNINNCDVEVQLKENEKPCFNYFVCTCKDEDRQYWKQQMLEYSSDIQDASVITSTLIMDLTHNYDMWVSDIACDMWFGLFVSSEHHDFYIQCDSVEHGLLCAVKIAEEIEKSK